MNPSTFSVADLIAMRDKSVNVAFMDFIHAVKCNPDALFVFYEGLDNDYYYPRIQQYTEREIEPVKCNGKGKVIGVYKIIITKPEYDKYCKGFFVDKDFDLNTDPALADFYVTSGYSIENCYLTDHCMETCLKQMFNFHSGDPLLSSIMDDYRIMRQKYLDAILLFNSWYCAIKRKYGNEIKDINLDKKMPKGYIYIDYAAKVVQQQYTIATIVSGFNAAQYPVTAKEVSEAEAYIRMDMLQNHRGKYGLSFLYEYLDNLLKQFKNTPEQASHYRKITISHDNILSILSPYADTERGVIDYIKRVAA